MCRVGSTVLMVGLAGREKALEKLPVRIVAMDTGASAIRCLRARNVATVVSHWDLVDVPNGKLLQNLIEARPGIPTIAFIRPGDTEQEIAARSIGVTVVLSEDIDDSYFCRTVCQILCLPAEAEIELTATAG